MIVTIPRENLLNSLSSEKYGYPIFTLPIFLSPRLIIVASPTLISLVQRNSKTLSFEHIVAELTTRMAPTDDGAQEVIMKGIETRDPSQSILAAMHDMQVENLGPGKILDELSNVQLKEMASIVNDEVGDVLETGLYEWLKHIVTRSNMFAAYGKNNVMVMDPSMEPAFWEFEMGLSVLIIGVAPWLFAPKAYRAQRKLSNAMVEWAEKGYWKDASTWIQNRRRLNTKMGLTPRQAAQVELGMMFGLLANAMPTTFWLIGYIWTHQELLRDLREQLENADGLLTAEGDKRIISISALKTKAPLLISVFREVLRINAPTASVRVVLEDTVVADQYLLKKGSIVQIPASLVNLDRSTWGSDAHEFNPRRFEKSANGTIADSGSETGKEKTVHPAAFRSFGGGTSLCPGRHFAQIEILGFTAMMALGFDLESADEEALELPEKKSALLPLSIYRPQKDLRVTVRRRKGMESVKWSFER